ncbi:MAG: DUF998 domain-containing protein [Phaeodactylibacter sp.]|nr:DUF998 domain-containing protein [Phaeodactylibacter sp.]MCB9049079.1 DUF998 domain-containing protein [Lewinellaceae bacterium]
MKSDSFWIQAGFAGCLLAGLGQFATDYWFAQHYPGYRWMAESVSYLGQVGSPVKQEVAVWGVVFAVLILLFGLGFFKAFSREGAWARLATGMIVLYGLGEGLGAGIFPVGPVRGGDAHSTFLHDLFSMAGDAGLMLLPLALMQVFSRKSHPAFFRLSWLTLVSGTLLASLFMLTKMYPQESGILYYRGVWQRAYILIYHLYLIVVSLLMLRRREGQKPIHD